MGIGKSEFCGKNSIPLLEKARMIVLNIVQNSLSLDYNLVSTEKYNNQTSNIFINILPTAIYKYSFNIKNFNMK